MAVITWKGRKALVKTSVGDFKYYTKKTKGCDSISLYKEDDTVLKAGFVTIIDAQKWLSDYLKFVK